MNFLNLSRRLNWIVWLGAFSLAPIVGAVVCGWLIEKLWGMEFPGGSDGKVFVMMMFSVTGIIPYIFNLMAYGLNAPQNHDQILAFYRQIERSLIKLIVIGLVARQLLPDWSDMTLGIVTATSLWLVWVDTYRCISVVMYIWLYARSEATLRQYLTNHYFTFFRR